MRHREKKPRSTLSRWNKRFKDMWKQPVTSRVLLRRCPEPHYISMISHYLRCAKLDDTRTFAVGILIASMLFLNGTIAQAADQSLRYQHKCHGDTHFAITASQGYNHLDLVLKHSTSPQLPLSCSIEARCLLPVMILLSYTKPPDTTTIVTEILHLLGRPSLKMRSCLMKVSPMLSHR